MVGVIRVGLALVLIGIPTVAQVSFSDQTTSSGLGLTTALPFDLGSLVHQQYTNVDYINQMLLTYVKPGVIARFNFRSRPAHGGPSRHPICL